MAEAGIHDGIGRLRNGTISDSGAKTNPNWNTTTTYSSTGFNNSFTVTHQVIGSSTVTDDGGTPLFSDYFNWHQFNFDKTNRSCCSSRVRTSFHKGIRGVRRVKISNNGFTDSYDSALGSYTSQVIPASSRRTTKTTNGPEIKDTSGATNAGADISIDGNAQIHGNAKATQYVTTSGTGVPTTGLGTPPILPAIRGHQTQTIMRLFMESPLKIILPPTVIH